MELSIDSLFSAGGLVGNLSYVLLIVSMAMRDIFWLRLLAIFSGVTGIAYDAVWLHDPVGVFWESCFTLVNALQWFVLVRERRGGLLSLEEERIRERLFPSLSQTTFRRLLDVATLHDVPAATELTRQGEPVPHLILISHGVADVEVDGAIVATCRGGDLVGELSFLTEDAATATVTTRAVTRFHAFETNALAALLAKSQELNTAFARMCNTNLVDKLVRTNEPAKV
jgi:hypothetical protein